MAHDDARWGGETAFDVVGDGPPVVLIHGLGLTRAMWRGQIAALSPDFRVLWYDLLGHGESAKPRDGYSLGRLAAQCVRAMDAAQIDRAAIVGFSLGGMVARAVARDHPDRAAALGILNSAHDRTEEERAAILARVRQAEVDGPRATVDAALARWFTPAYAAAHPEALDEIRAMVEANDPEVYPRLYRVLAEGDQEIVDVLAAYPEPVLAMTATDDAGNSPDMARRMAAQAPNGVLEIVPGGRHLGLMETPDAYSAPLSAFLRGALLGD